MSARNREGQRSARERLREERERRRAGERRLRLAKVLGIGVVVLGVAAGAGFLAAGSGNDDDNSGPAAEPIAVGDPAAPAVLTVYEDFRCPACAQFENTFRGTVNELVDAGQLRVDYHLVTIIDGNMRGTGSRYAANAAACARDQGVFPEYHDLLFENQPAETDDAFGDKSWLIELGRQVDGLDGAAFQTCVEDGTHDDWVSRANGDFLNGDHAATPTVLLNGDQLGQADTPFTTDYLRERVAELAG
ncbi:thioredoxin domain-containing protein [Streptomyces sp. DSM 44915]|uniref:Thioredoxin domain-containing protein n=1 Tax=Streptomyces chisholmiae TaxID=3075540 RepID=A0ABU2JJ77_9ACTN|nr:thioredoxin domain-containing protein [Streptomyces sp. DSM 44915]MDT0265045.1 thioredoxin domain-containing protein [Streptomyces sp. DSM 44915]